MSDLDDKITEQDASPPSSTNDAAMAAFSTDMEALSGALSILYIRNNASGRNKFREKWPKVARYMFGDTLITYDDEGTDDWDHRAKLEEDAEERRMLIKTTMAEIIEKSVDSGQLQFDYVGSIIDKFGAEMSSFLYAPDIIERVRPGILAQAEAENKDSDKTNDDATPNPDNAQHHETPDAPNVTTHEKDVPPTPMAEDSPPSLGDDNVALQTDDDRALLEAEKKILSNLVDDDISDSVRPIDIAEKENVESTTPTISQEGKEDSFEPRDDSADKASEADQEAKVENVDYTTLFNNVAK